MSIVDITSIPTDVFEYISAWFSKIGNSGLEQILKEYGYIAILILTFLEGETVVIIAGAFAASGLLDPSLIVLSAFCGTFSSDQLMFSLGKYKGTSILSRFPKISKNVDKASILIKKYNTLIILGFRFVYGVRNVTPILLGISGINHGRFFALNFIGALVWAISFTAGGYYFGKFFEHFMERFGVGFLIGLIVIIVSVILAVIIGNKLKNRK